MKAELRIKLNVDNAAFEDNGVDYEIDRIIHGALVVERFAARTAEVAANPCPYTRSHDLLDSNGNTCGQFTIQISEVD